MKKLFLILGLIIAIHTQTKAQQEKQNAAGSYLTTIKPVLLPGNYRSSTIGLPGKGPERDADFYFHRAKSQRTVGWITLGGGLVLSGIGLLLLGGDVTSSNANDDAAAVCFLVGATSGIVSIPFMIMASANRHKAKTMLSTQKTGFGAPSNVGKYITGITMTIPIGK